MVSRLVLPAERLYSFSGRGLQSWIKASSYCQVSGFQLTNSGSCEDSLLVNWSMDNGPRRWLIFWNRMGESFHSNCLTRFWTPCLLLYSQLLISAEPGGECSSLYTTTTGPLLAEKTLVMPWCKQLLLSCQVAGELKCQTFPWQRSKLLG